MKIQTDPPSIPQKPLQYRFDTILFDKTKSPKDISDTNNFPSINWKRLKHILFVFQGYFTPTRQSSQLPQGQKNKYEKNKKTETHNLNEIKVQK